MAAGLLPLDPDALLSTTRAVRKRLDFERPVEPELIRECLEMALQAPTGSNAQGWHFVVVTDAEKRRDSWKRHLETVAGRYRDASSALLEKTDRLPAGADALVKSGTDKI